MNCGIVVRHPEHARFFAPVYRYLTDRGHDASVFVRENAHASAILADAGVPHEVLAGEASSRLGLVTGHAVFEARLLAAARRDGFDVLTAVGGVSVSHLAPLVGARSVVFADWERRGVVDDVVVSLADAVCTPRFVASSFGDAHRRYEGFHELSHLDPARFEPDEDVPDELGFDRREPVLVLSFLDRGDESRRAATALAAVLDARGDCYLSHESLVPGGFDDLPRVPATAAPDALAHANLYVGNSGTMAAEAAVLGTPSVWHGGPGQNEPRCRELAERYGLVRSSPDWTALFGEVERILDDPDAGHVWERRRDALLEETVDVAAWVGDALVDAAED